MEGGGGGRWEREIAVERTMIGKEREASKRLSTHITKISGEFHV